MKGSIQGEKTRKFPDFIYRKVKETNLTYREMDPDRVYYDRYYPRFTPAMPQVSMPIIDLIDYEIRLDEQIDRVKVEVWLIPNQYTRSQTEKMIFEIFINHQLMTKTKEAFHEILHMAFD